jgi:diaminopropionate ammonia-lyase
MLECNRPSPLAWEILDPTADYFMSIDDSLAVPAMRALAMPIASDPRIVAGESGVAGFAAMAWTCSDQTAKAVLGLDSNSVVAVINTEGATDPSRYRELVGVDPL